MTKKILLVDDEPLVVQLMQQRFESQDWEVETAQEGQDAFEKAKTYQPDVIVLDIAMPGLNGYEVCRRLKEDEMTKHIPVIMFTALQEVRLEERAARAGAARLVQKPFVNHLSKAIEEILSQSR